jgi:hypothetical protein
MPRREALRFHLKIKRLFDFKAAADSQNGFLEENLSIGFLPHYSSTGYIVFAVIYRNNNAKYNAMSG